MTYPFMREPPIAYMVGRLGESMMWDEGRAFGALLEIERPSLDTG